MKRLFKKYWHAIPLLIYAPIYLLWFQYLEQTVTKDFYVIHMDLDDYIPFCEIFVIPYMLWFAYVALVVLYLFFTNRSDYGKCCVFLFTGMTIFLLISTLWPNGHLLRPKVMPRDNIFTQIISSLYEADTSTNIWPSIHVYNSIGAHLAIAKNKALQKYKGIQLFSLILSISIILSTVFIKQHSLFDMLSAFVLAGIMYTAVYAKEQASLLRFFAVHRKNRSKTQTSH